VRDHMFEKLNTIDQTNIFFFSKLNKRTVFYEQFIYFFGMKAI